MRDLHGFWKEPKAPVKPKSGGPTKRRQEKREARKAKRKAARLGVTPQALSKVQPRTSGKPHRDYRKDDTFYKSEAWRRVRYVALKMHGGKCQCCGVTAADGAVICVDHVIPRYKAPHLSLDVANLQVLCNDCNIGKAAWDDTDWRPVESMDADAMAHMRSIVKGSG